MTLILSSLVYWISRRWCVNVCVIWLALWSCLHNDWITHWRWRHEYRHLFFNYSFFDDFCLCLGVSVYHFRRLLFSSSRRCWRRIAAAAAGTSKDTITYAATTQDRGHLCENNQNSKVSSLFCFLSKTFISIFPFHCLSIILICEFSVISLYCVWII